MKKPLLVALSLLCPASWCLGGNLIPDDGFDHLKLAKPVELANAVDATSISGWRLFTSVAAARAVRFEATPEGARHPEALKMEMVYNPSGSTEGRIGFDRYGHLLAVTPGSILKLTFEAKLANAARCGVMVTLAGHNAAGALVSQQTQVFDPAKDFQPFAFAPWTVPAGATQMNVIFNLVEPGQQVQPRDPCGVLVGGIDLEKVSS